MQHTNLGKRQGRYLTGRLPIIPKKALHHEEHRDHEGFSQDYALFDARWAIDNLEKFSAFLR
ncbi:MAG: hypothetical protein WAW87_11810 [Candidatus Ferrigenium altingense]